MSGRGGPRFNEPSRPPFPGSQPNPRPRPHPQPTPKPSDPKPGKPHH